MTTRQIELNQSLSQRGSTVSTQPYKKESKSSFSWNEYKDKNNFSSHIPYSSSPNISQPSKIQSIQHEIPTVSITSWIFFFKRIALGFFTLPMALFFTPCIFAFVWIFLREISNNHPFFFVLTSLIMHIVAQKQIEIHAPNQDEAKKALYRSRIWLPLCCIVLAIIGCRQLGILGSLFKYIPFMSDMIKTTELRSAYSSFAFFVSSCGWGFCFASLGLLLNLIVIIRFVGPVAVVQCANGPLQLNPCNVMTKGSLVETIRSILTAITSPSLTSSKSSQFQKYQQPSMYQKTYQKPTIAFIVIHIFMYAILGYIFTSFLPFDGSIVYINIICTCVMSGTEILMNGKHVINTSHYPSLHDCDSIFEILQFMITEIKKSKKNEFIFFSSGLSIFVSLILNLDKNTWLSNISISTAFDLFFTITSAVFISFTTFYYLTLSDTLHRLFLSQKIKSVESLVSSLKTMTPSSKNVFVTQILIRTLLQNSYVTKQILSFSLPSYWSRLNNSFSLVQEQHTTQLQEMTNIMSIHYFQCSPYIQLPEEILRVKILETLDLSSYSSDISQEEQKYHLSCILKSLSVYIGGFGDALISLLSPTSMKMNGESYLQHDMNQKKTKVIMSLPDSAILQTKYVIDAVIRILSNSKNVSNFTHFHLHYPTLLQNLFALHKGFKLYGKHMMTIDLEQRKLHVNIAGVTGKGGNDFGAELNRFMAVRLPETKNILMTCSNAARSIATSERVMEEWRQSTLLCDECKYWLNSILDEYR